MLKSHFSIKYDDDESAEEEQELEIVKVEKKEVIPERNLNQSEVSVRLSMLGKTAEGDGYSYLKCKITGLKMTNIDVIAGYTNLMFLDVSNNLLSLEALQVITKLPHLVLIQADNNMLTSAAIKQMKYLQVIILNHNKITSVHDVYQQHLSTLEIANNKLTKIEFQAAMPTIRVLDFRNNAITDISNFLDYKYPILDSLYLAGNKLKSLTGLERCVSLRILHVRDNPIRLLNGFDEALEKLQYINLRNCKVATLRQIKKLRVLTGLETLIIRGCPYMGGAGDEEDTAGEEEDPQLRVEVLAALQRLKRLNKVIISPEEREEAKQLMLTWLEEGEKDQEEEIEEEQMMDEQAAVEEAGV